MWPSFEQSFWDSAWSGLAVGLVAGVLVGLALFVVQKGSDRRRLEAEYGRDLEVFVEELRDAVAQVDPYKIGPATDTESSRARAVSDLAKRRPLLAWKNLLPDKGPLVDLVLDVARGNAAFIRAAAVLDLQLSQIVRAHNAAANIDSFNDRHDLSFYVARKNDISEDGVLLWLSMPGAGPRFNLSYAKCDSSPEIGGLWSSYAASRSAVSESLQKLIALLASLAAR